MNDYSIKQISVFEALEPGHAGKRAQEDAENALSLIIKRVEDQLIQRGRPCGWVARNADTTQKYTCFLPRGVPHNRSSCPHYEGYWLDGCYASVQCALHSSLIPGIIWDEVCRYDGGAACPLKSNDTPLSCDS